METVHAYKPKGKLEKDKGIYMPKKDVVEAVFTEDAVRRLAASKKKS